MIKYLAKSVFFFAILIGTIKAASPTDWGTFIHPYDKPFYSMMNAVFYNDYQKVKELLKSGISPNIETREGLTPIKLAIDLNHDSIYNLLAETPKKYNIYLYNKAIKNKNLKQIKKLHKNGFIPFIFPHSSYFKRPYSIEFLKHIIPFFQYGFFYTKNFYSEIPLPQTQKEAKELASLIHLMILNGFFPKSAIDSLWLETITNRSIDSSYFFLPKRNNTSNDKSILTINSHLASVFSINLIDSLLVLGADPLGPTESPKYNALDKRRESSKPFDWLAISFFQKRDPIRIKPLLNNDDLFFIALVEGDLNEVKNRLAKIDLQKKNSSFLKMILPTATYSGNLSLIQYIQKYPIPFFESSWYSSFIYAIKSKKFELIKKIYFMHPDPEKASSYIRSVFNEYTYNEGYLFDNDDFFQMLKNHNLLLSLINPIQPFDNEIHVLKKNKILIKYNFETNQYEPLWKFESLYDQYSYETCAFSGPSPWKIDLKIFFPTKDTIKEFLTPQTSNYWEICGSDSNYSVYALIEYKNQIIASTKYGIINSNDGGITWKNANRYLFFNAPFTTFIVHQDRLFVSTFSTWGTESVYESLYNEENNIELRRMSFGLYRKLDSLKTKKNKLFSISNSLYFADSSVEKTYRFDFDTYTWKQADTSLIEFIDEKNSSIEDTLKSKNGIPLLLKKHLYQTLQYKQRLFAATEKGLLFSDNQGKNWNFATIQDNHYYPEAENLFASDSSISFFRNDSLFFLDNTGYYWQGVPAENIFINSFASIDSTHFIATNTGLIRLSKNTSSEKVNTFSGIDYFKSIAFFDNILWAASGESSSVIFSSDSGFNWKEADCFTPSDPQIYKFYQKENDLYAATDLGVYKYKKSKCWSRLPIKGLKDQKILNLVASDKELFAVNDSGKIYKATIPVKKWTPLSQKINHFLFKASDILYHKNILIAATNRGPLFSYNQGNTWTLHEAGLPKNSEVKSIAIFKNILFAIIDDNIYRFDLP